MGAQNVGQSNSGREMKTDRIDDAHRAFIRTLPCVVCTATAICAHVRMSEYGGIVVPVDERGGMGLKPDDRWTLPLCRTHHDMQHTVGEVPFWDAGKVNPLALAQSLYANTGKREACLNIILRHRNQAEDL